MHAMPPFGRDAPYHESSNENKDFHPRGPDFHPRFPAHDVENHHRPPGMENIKPLMQERVPMRPPGFPVSLVAFYFTFGN